jgi:hypothetical protein
LLQECVSDIVSKYLPPELPPWQITIIPSFGVQEDRFYLLIRIHHLLLSEEDLCLGDLLLLGPEQPTIFKRRLDEDDENPRHEIPPSSVPLTGMFPGPVAVAIPRLYSNFRCVIISRWTQLAAAYDPAQNPEILKAPPGIRICAGLILITGVSIIKELLVLARRTDVSLYRKTLSITSTIAAEVSKRQRTAQHVWRGILTTLKPRQLIVSCVSESWRVSYILAVRLPVFVVSEIRSFVSRRNDCDISENRSETAFSQWSLVLAAIKELFHICTIVYTAPRILVQELITSHRGAMHQLQTVSLCGRKVVAWSDPIPLEMIRKISLNMGATSTEILLSSVSGALREYFRQFPLRVPESVLTTARYIPLEVLIRPPRSVEESSGSASGRGLLCLALPTSPIYDDPKESVLETQRILHEAWERQVAVYQVTAWQLDGGYMTRILPTLAVRLVFNHLSRRYAVALTEVSPEISGETRYRLIWGQEVESAMYWRPPQSNISEYSEKMTTHKL